MKRFSEKFQLLKEPTVFLQRKVFKMNLQNCIHNYTFKGSSNAHYEVDAVPDIPTSWEVSVKVVSSHQAQGTEQVLSTGLPLQSRITAVTMTLLHAVASFTETIVTRLLVGVLSVVHPTKVMIGITASLQVCACIQCVHDAAYKQFRDTTKQHYSTLVSWIACLTLEWSNRYPCVLLIKHCVLAIYCVFSSI